MGEYFRRKRMICDLVYPLPLIDGDQGLKKFLTLKFDYKLTYLR